MNGQQRALATRLVASPHWRWVEGTLAGIPGDSKQYRIIWSDGDTFGGVEDGACWPKSWGVEAFDSMDPMTTADGWLPCLNEAATIGVIEHLAREVWHGNHIEVWSSIDGWGISVNGLGVSGTVLFRDGFQCRGSAWAEALLAAPC